MKVTNSVKIELSEDEALNLAKILDNVADPYSGDSFERDLRDLICEEVGIDPWEL
jgi:hypothetical protein